VTVSAVLKAAAAAGVSVTIDGDELVLRADSEPDAAVVALIREHKPQIAHLLRQAGWSETDWQALFDERAAILEYDGGFSRSEAEQRATDEMTRIRRNRTENGFPRRPEKHRGHRGHRKNG